MAAQTKIATLTGELHQEIPDNNLPAVITDQELTTPQLMQLAIQRMDGSNAASMVDVLERLVGLQERMEERSAVKAFNAALAAFQAECPSFSKGKLVNYTSKRTGQTVKYRYGELNEVREHIKPHLKNNRLSISWDYSIEGGEKFSVCTLSHVDGHSKSSKFPITVEEANEKSFRSGAQESGAAETYAMRRAMISVLGLTGYDPDTDAKRRDDDAVQPDVKVDRNQAANIEALISEVGADRAKFLAVGGYADVSEIPASDYKAAVAMLERKRAKK